LLKINIKEILEIIDANNKISSLNSNNNNSNAYYITKDLIYNNIDSKKDKTDNKTKLDKSSKDGKGKGNISRKG
jgi:hypothetical protein